MPRAILRTLGLLTLVAFPPLLAQDAGYTVGGDIRMERQGSIYLDAVGHRLYVAQAPYEKLAAGAVVYNTDSKSVVGRLSLQPEITSVGGIAISPDLGKGWASSGDFRSVTPFNLVNFAPEKEISLKDAARTLAYDSVSKRLFVLSAHDVFAIDAASGTVIATIPVGNRASYAETDGKGMLMVTISDPGAGTVVVIDTKTAKEVRRYKIDKCGAPGRFALDPATGHLFTGCSGRSIAVTDPTAGTVVSLLTTKIVTSRLAFSSSAGLLAPMNTEDALAVLRRDAAGAYAISGDGVPLAKLKVTDMRSDRLNGRIYVAATGSTGKDFRILVLEKK